MQFVRGSVRQHAARGTIINGGFLVGVNVLGLVRGFVLAGLISRSDFGLWGILAVSLATLVTFKQAGIGDKFIQQDEQDQELAFQKAFTMELVVSGLLSVVLVAALPLFALAYGLPELIAPGLVLVTLLAAGAFQAPLWVFYRRMQYGQQRLLQSVEPVVATVLGVGIALAGGGYWALIVGPVAGAWCTAALAIAFSPFKLRFVPDRATARRYWEFSWPLFVASASGMVIAQCAIVATKGHLGLAAAGVVALASTITAFTDRVDQIVTGTLYPAICAAKDRRAVLFESFVKSNRLTLMWAVPFGMALTLFAADLVDFGIGDRWQPLVVVLQVYGVIAALNHIGFNWDAYFRARAETGPMAVAGVATGVTFLVVGLPLLFAYGLPGLAAGVAAQGLAGLIVRIYYLRGLFRGFDFLRHALRAVLPSIPAVAVVLLLRQVEPGDRTLAVALAELATYVALTAVATWYCERGLLREATGYLIGARARHARV